MTAGKFARDGISLTLSQATVQICSFLRNVFIAHLVSPADLGIAATFVMTWSVIEMFSVLAPDKLLIQAEDGDEPKFQKTVQFIQATRGLMIATFIFLLAGPISNLLSVPQAKWALQCLALAPLLRGFNHADMSRMQREMKFRQAIMVEMTSSLLVTLFAVLLGFWLRDYSLMLAVLIIQATLSLLVSHIVAERPYRWALDRQYARRILTFGWPLLVNGVFIWVIFQGDQFVIGSAKKLFSGSIYNISDLGIYSLAFSLTMAPALSISNVSTSLILPLFCAVRNSRREFERRYVACARALSLMAALVSIPLIVGGHWIVLFLYGRKYEAAGALMGWLAAMWALRTIRMAPTLAAMAKTDTQNAMISNTVRTIALLGVILAVAFGEPLTWVAACGFFGEVLATAVNVGRLGRRHGVPSALCLKPTVVTLVGMGIAAMASGIYSGSWFADLVISGVLIAMVVVVMFSIFPELRRDVRAVVFRSQSPVIA